MNKLPHDGLPQWNEMLIKLNRDRFLPISLIPTGEITVEAREAAAATVKQVAYTTFNSLRSQN